MSVNAICENKILTRIFQIQYLLMALPNRYARQIKGLSHFMNSLHVYHFNYQFYQHLSQMFLVCVVFGSTVASAMTSADDIIGTITRGWLPSCLSCVLCFLVFCLFPKCFLVHIRIKGEVGAVKLV